MLQRGYARAADSYMLVKAAMEGWDPDLLVHGMLRFFNTPQFIEFARHLADDPAITHATAQCTRYRPGHYLLPHEDLDVSEGRRYAFVVNLGATGGPTGAVNCSSWMPVMPWSKPSCRAGTRSACSASRSAIRSPWSRLGRCAATRHHRLVAGEIAAVFPSVRTRQAWCIDAQRQTGIST